MTWRATRGRPYTLALYTAAMSGLDAAVLPSYGATRATYLQSVFDVVGPGDSPRHVTHRVS